MVDITVYLTVFQQERMGPPFYFPMYDFSEPSQQRTRRAMEEERFKVVYEINVPFSGDNHERIRTFAERTSEYVLGEANEAENLDIEQLERIVNGFRG